MIPWVLKLSRDGAAHPQGGSVGANLGTTRRTLRVVAWARRDGAAHPQGGSVGAN